MDLASPLDFFLAILPAMVANASPVAARKLLGGRRWRPLDGGRYFVDGRRILGDGKTIEGFAVGVAAGSLIAAVIALIAGDAGYLIAGSVGSVGALLGDIVGSFIKRRLGLERGAPAPLLDQLDFYVGATVAIRIIGYRLDTIVTAAFAGLIVALHIATNYIAFKLGLKEVPW
ncbi:MAG: CDP-2,3-bis-(O-geranylgeranyl)-sn-glycerol synthase [Desulfurococcales archaeon]|nr:CDP-2,3-bis-(O-geranylgeranyl)-sn-glycerol synthase [Desulfurococcales archaeon]